ncbi:putative endoplasmic reticulum membrane protein [Diplonema papillatum]|nr:putative endoplasmic reticulum membrane protein [Diplonema papillatum]
MGFLPDTKKNLCFYAEYHHDVVNQWIHIICVPMLLWTGQVFLSELSVAGVSATWIVTALYAIFYVALDPIVGLGLTVLLCAGAYTAIDFMHAEKNAYKIAIGVHIASWIAQFIGHGVFEKRAPALFTSFFQSLFLAPFFVSLEVLFKMGLRQDVHQEVNEEVCRRLAKIREQKKVA